MKRWLAVFGLATLISGMWAGFSPAPTSAEELKIGYINSMRVRDEYKEFAEAQTKFDKEVAEYQKQDQQKRAQLDSLIQAFETQSLLLSDAKKKDRQAEIEAKKDEYRKFFEDTFGPEGLLEKKNAEMTKPLLDKINAVLEKIAVQENYAYIFDAVNANIAYAKPQYDLTERVIEELQK